MEFFNKIYNSDYFIIGLFVVIAILLVIFVLLIISGKKEKNKKEESEMDEVSKNLETIDNVKMMASNNNEEKLNEKSSLTIESEKKEEKEISDNVSETKETKNEELFNTSIFHGLPQELTQEIKKEDESSVIPDSLFEPLPNLDMAQDTKVSEEKETDSFVLPTFESVNFELPQINNQDGNIKPNIPDLPKVDIPAKTNDSFVKENILPKEDILPKANQFSSVYVSKGLEQPVKEEKKEENKDKPLAYDPSLFTSYVKKQDPIDLDKTITNMPIPEIAAVPPMQSINEIKEEKPINHNNSFDFELPTLAGLDSLNKEEKKEENSFPTFNNETYNINK